MAAVTRFGPGGGPRMLLGSFSSKVYAGPSIPSTSVWVEALSKTLVRTGTTRVLVKNTETD